uniref:Uncharacterized protein n=1 Tax=Setaria viridis TaxID=4556 RepID=A0A4U6T7U3_SETVI|nr:hypothetical protein SEVIR_9G250600v2 [Setaria viridis]
MVRRSLKTMLMLLLISLLVMTDMSIVSYGRRVAELGVDDGSGGGGLPPAYFSKQASSSASGRRLGQCCKHMLVASKRYSSFRQTYTQM